MPFFLDPLLFAQALGSKKSDNYRESNNRKEGMNLKRGNKQYKKEANKLEPITFAVTKREEG